MENVENGIDVYMFFETMKKYEELFEDGGITENALKSVIDNYNDLLQKSILLSSS